MKCIEDEIPFDLPDGWEWVRLGCLAQYKKGPFGSSITKAMFVPDTPDAVKIYEQKNAINKDATLGSYFISAEKYETLKGFEVFPNDIIVSCAGTIGETYVLPIGILSSRTNIRFNLFTIRSCSSIGGNANGMRDKTFPVRCLMVTPLQSALIIPRLS